MAKKNNKTTLKATKDGVVFKTSGGNKAKLRYSSKLFIAIAIVVLIVVTAVLVLRFGFPNTWNKIFAFFAPPGVEGNPAGDLAVHFVDVGQGDCIIIQLPDGKNAIIDAGGNPKNYTEENPEKRIFDNIRDLKISTFDYMILTHPDKDHVDFMDSVLEECDVKNIYRPAFNSRSEASRGVNPEYATVTSDVYEDFVNAVNNEVEEIGAVVKFNIDKQSITGEGYRFDIYGVAEKYYTKAEVDDEVEAFESNRVSPMVLLSYNAKNDVRRIMFTGDSEGKGGNGGEDLFMQEYNDDIDIDLLKVGHHGSSSSASDAFLKRLDPEYAVISVGTNGQYGHPNQKCLDRLSSYTDGRGQYGIKVYMTKDCGDIIFRVNQQGEISFHTDVKVAA